MRDYVVLINVDDAVSRTVARRLRAEHIYCRIEPVTTPAAALMTADVRGLIVAAGSTGVTAKLPELPSYLDAGLPLLCLGDAALTLCEATGGALSDLPLPCGVEQVQFNSNIPLLHGAEDGERFLRNCRYMTQFTPEMRHARVDIRAVAFQPRVNPHDFVRFLFLFCRSRHKAHPSDMEIINYNKCTTKSARTQEFS